MYILIILLKNGRFLNSNVMNIKLHSFFNKIINELHILYFLLLYAKY